MPLPTSRRHPRSPSPSKGFETFIIDGSVFQQQATCFEVYKEKGSGFLEAVYQECLTIEFESQGIPHIAHPDMCLAYKGRPLLQVYRPDFVCYGMIVLELKAVSNLLDEHRAQVHNYLKASGHKLGLLVNFSHHPQLEYERIVR